MINCPNCGNPVREDAKFCGNCGVDVQAALQAAQAAAAAEPQPTPYAYPQQQPSSFGGFDFRRNGETSPMTARIVIAAVIVVAVACAFICGCIFGGYVEGYLLAPTTPAPKPTPTKESLQFLETILRLAI